MVRDFPVFEIEYINLNVNSPTTVTLTEEFFPAPTLLTGTQVYVPSDITVTLKIPKLLVIMSLLLKYKWNSASGLASAWHVNLRGLLRRTVVLLRAEMSFAPPGASKKKRESNHETDKGYRQLLLSVYYSVTGRCGKVCVTRSTIKTNKVMALIWAERT